MRLVALAAFLLQWSVASVAMTQDRTAEPLPTIGGHGGTSFTRQCPQGQVLTGLRARTGPAIDAVGVRCRPVSATGTLGTESDVGSLAGGGGGTSSSGSCPSGTVVSGQAGGTDGPYVSTFVLRCRRWDAATRSFAGAAVANVRVTGGAPGAVVVVSTALPDGLQSVDCSRSTQPAVLLRGRSSTVIDAVGLTCNEP